MMIYLIKNELLLNKTVYKVAKSMPIKVCFQSCINNLTKAYTVVP